MKEAMFEEIRQEVQRAILDNDYAMIASLYMKLTNTRIDGTLIKILFAVMRGASNNQLYAAMRLIKCKRKMLAVKEAWEAAIA